MAQVRLIVDVTRNDKGELQAAAREVDALAGKQAKLTKQTAESQAVFRDFGATLLKAFAFGAITKFLDDSLRAQAAQVDSINRLNLALANQGKFTEATSKSLVDYSAALQQTSTFGDEVILAGEAMLASFGQNEAQIKRTTKTALDFAAATGTDLQASITLLGKAFVGETSTLSRYGVVVDENIPKAQKFEAAMSQLERRFSGSAQAATQTYTGGLAQLHNAFGDTQEALGKLLGEFAGSDRPFGALISNLERLTTFLGRDAVVALSEFRARYLETIADLVGSKIGSFLANQKAGPLLGIASMLGISGSDAKDLDNYRRALLDEAAAARKTGDEAAAAAGKTTAYTNATHFAAAGTSDAAKAAEKWADALRKIQIETGKLEQKVSGEFFKDLQEIARGGAGQDFTGLGFRGDIGQQFLQFLQAQRKSAEASDALNQNARFERWLSTQQQLTRATFDWSRALGDVSHAFQIMGVSADSTFAKIATGFLAGMAGAQQLRQLAAQQGGSVTWGQAGAGALQAATGAYGAGLLGGAAQGASFGSAFGPLGAAIGGVAGGILGLFGGNKEQKQVNDMRDQFLASFGGFEALQKKLVGLTDQDLVKKVFDARTVEQFNAAVKEVTDTLALPQKRLEALQQAVGAVGGAFARFSPDNGQGGTYLGGLLPNTEEDARSQALIFTTTFNAAVKQMGFVGASDALRDSFQSLWESLSTVVGPEVEQAILGPIQRYMDLTKPGSEGDPAGLFRGAAEGASALAQVLGGLTQQELPLTVQQFGAFEQQAKSAFDQAIAGGATTQEAYQAIGPLLQEIVKASSQYGIQLDANTQSLVDQAAAAGVAFKTDPNDRLIASLDALTTTLGGVPPRFADIATSATAAADTAGTAMAGYGATVDQVIADQQAQWQQAWAAQDEQAGKILDGLVGGVASIGREADSSFGSIQSWLDRLDGQEARVAVHVDQDRGVGDYGFNSDGTRRGPDPATWYGSGVYDKLFSSPTLIGVGERGPERVTVTPASVGRTSSARATATVNVTVAPQVVVRDESLIKTPEGVAAFRRLLTEAGDELLRVSNNVLATRVQQMIRDAQRSAG